MFTVTFWKDAVERAVKTFCQSLVAVLGAGSVGLLSVPWTTSLSTAGLAALLSLLTSVGSSPLGRRGDPSLLPAERQATPK